MSQTVKSKSPRRGERHSAAWGKRLSMVLLLLVGQSGFAQAREGRPSGKFAAELAPAVARAHQGSTNTETVKVIVQYKLAPHSEQEGRMTRLGGRLKSKARHGQRRSVHHSGESFGCVRGGS